MNIEYENPYIVYVKTNDSNYIVAVNSSEFLSNTIGWIEIDRGYGDKYHHAQNNYFKNPISTDSCAYRYKLVDGVAVECAEDEIKEQEQKLLIHRDNKRTAQDDVDAMLIEHEYRITLLELGL